MAGSADVDEILRQAVDTLSTPMSTPGYKAVDTKALKSEVGRASQSRNYFQDVLNTEAGKSAVANDEEKDAITRSGQASKDKAIADQDQAQKIADNNVSVHKLLGIGVNPEDAAATLATNITKTRPVLEKERQDIQDMMNVGPLDNPIEWLANGLQLPGKIKTYNSKAQQVDDWQTALDNGIATSTALAAEINRGLPTITMAQAKATGDKAVAEADKLKAVTDKEFAKVNVDFASKKLAADITLVTANMHMTQMDIEQNKLKYESALNAIRLADTHAARQLQAAKLLEQLQDSAGLDVLIKNYDLQVGNPEGTTTRAGMKFKTKPDQDEVMAIGGSSRFGNSPLQAFESASKIRFGPLISEDTKAMYRQLSQWVATAQDTPNVQKALPEQKRAQLAIATNNRIAAEFKEASNPKSFFHEFDPAKMLASGAIPIDSEMGKVLAPLAKGGTEVTSALIADTFEKSFGNNAGAALAEYYQKNMELRNKALALETIGIPAVIKAAKLDITAYKTKVGGIFDSMTLDLTKPGDANKFILIRKNKAQILETPGGVPGG